MKETHLIKRVDKAVNDALSHESEQVRNYFKSLIVKEYKEQVNNKLNKRFYKDNLELLKSIIYNELNYEYAVNITDAKSITTKEN